MHPSINITQDYRSRKQLRQGTTIVYVWELTVIYEYLMNSGTSASTPYIPPINHIHSMLCAYVVSIISAVIHIPKLDHWRNLRFHDCNGCKKEKKSDEVFDPNPTINAKLWLCNNISGNICAVFHIDGSWIRQFANNLLFWASHAYSHWGDDAIAEHALPMGTR